MTSHFNSDILLLVCGNNKEEFHGFKKLQKKEWQHESVEAEATIK